MTDVNAEYEIAKRDRMFQVMFAVEEFLTASLRVTRRAPETDFKADEIANIHELASGVRHAMRLSTLELGRDIVEQLAEIRASWLDFIGAKGTLPRK